MKRKSRDTNESIIFLIRFTRKEAYVRLLQQVWCKKTFNSPTQLLGMTKGSCNFNLKTIRICHLELVEHFIVKLRDKV